MQGTTDVSGEEWRKLHFVRQRWQRRTHVAVTVSYIRLETLHCARDRCKLTSHHHGVNARITWLPIVSIVVPFFGLTKYYNRDPIR